MKESRLLRVVLIPAVLGAYIGYGSADHPEFPSQTSDDGQPKVERLVSPQRSAYFFSDVDLFSSGYSREITPTSIAETATPIPVPSPIVSEPTPTPQPQSVINEATPESTVEIARENMQIADSSEQPQPISCESAWEENFLPTSLVIPNIHVESGIQPVYSIPVSEIRITWPVPDHGIATSVDHRIYSIHVFGHSSWGGVRSPFADIEYLGVGAQIGVKNEANESFCFEVTGFALADKFQDSYLGGYSEPTVILQTTARYKRSWILNRQNILEKVGHDEQPASVGDLAFLVFAKELPKK